MYIVLNQTIIEMIHFTNTFLNTFLEELNCSKELTAIRENFGFDKFPTSHLADGVYILTRQIGERMFREKMVVQR